MKLSRDDRSLLSEWWFTIDRMMLLAILLLMALGLMLSLAASPPIAMKHGLDTFYFVKKHSLWFLPSLCVLFVVSFLTRQQMRRVSLALFITGIALMSFVLTTGEEVNGAKRWLQVAGLSIQPSEFTKPAFVILIAWFFSESSKRRDVPAQHIGHAIYLIFATLMLLQPDFGQTLLISCVWAGLYFLTGVSIFWIAVIALLALAGLITAYYTLPHVAVRLDRFWDPAAGDTYQVDRAIQSFVEGGWFGRGPGEGQLKRALPDSHTDFTFAVVGEEFGIIVCLILLTLFGFIVLRALYRAMYESDMFKLYAVTGLSMLFGLQALINMSVNVGILPAKGMTLPLISYGGSSLLGLSIAMGMVVGLTRRTVDNRLTSRSGPVIRKCEPFSRELSV